MNKWLALLPTVAALTVIGLVAAAQEVVVCPTGDPDQCYAVDPNAPVAQAEEPSPPVPGPNQVWLEWRAVQDDPDPLLEVPGFCARSPGRARYRFWLASQSGDLNKVVESYQWRGKNEEQSLPILDRLATVTSQGHWERSVVGMWSGADDTPKKAPVFWRWVDQGGVMNLALRSVDGCWFVEFASDPGESVTVDGPSRAYQPPPALAPPGVDHEMPEPEDPDVLVF